MVGEMMSSMPMFVRFLSPPETPRMNSFPIYKVIYVKFAKLLRRHTCGIIRFVYRTFFLTIAQVGRRELLAFVSAQRTSPSSCITDSTRSFLTSALILSDSLTLAEKARFSRTVNVFITMSSCDK